MHGNLWQGTFRLLFPQSRSNHHNNLQQLGTLQGTTRNIAQIVQQDGPKVQRVQKLGLLLLLRITVEFTKEGCRG